MCTVCVGRNCSRKALYSKPGCEFSHKRFTNETGSCTLVHLEMTLQNQKARKSVSKRPVEEYLCSDGLELMLVFVSQLLLLLQPLAK